MTVRQQALRSTVRTNLEAVVRLRESTYQHVRIDVLHDEVADIVHCAVSAIRERPRAYAHVAARLRMLNRDQGVVLDDRVQIAGASSDTSTCSVIETTHPSKSPPPSIEASDRLPVVLNMSMFISGYTFQRIDVPTEGSTTTFLSPRKKHSLPAGGSPMAHTRWTVTDPSDPASSHLWSETYHRLDGQPGCGISTQCLCSRPISFSERIGTIARVDVPLRYTGFSSASFWMHAAQTIHQPHASLRYPPARSP